MSKCLISADGLALTDDLSRRLLSDHLTIARQRWTRSNRTFASSIGDIQSDLQSSATLSIKRAMRGCQATMINWIARSQFK